MKRAFELCTRSDVANYTSSHPKRIPTRGDTRVWPHNVQPVALRLLGGAVGRKELVAQVLAKLADIHPFQLALGGLANIACGERLGLFEHGRLQASRSQEFATHPHKEMGDALRMASV
jgi:hypothetical protein